MIGNQFRRKSHDCESYQINFFFLGEYGFLYKKIKRKSYNNQKIFCKKRVKCATLDTQVKLS